MMAPPAEPATNTHRQPSMPNGWRGTKARARKPTAGTPMNPTV